MWFPCVGLQISMQLHRSPSRCCNLLNALQKWALASYATPTGIASLKLTHQQKQVTSPCKRSVALEKTVCRHLSDWLHLVTFSCQLMLIHSFGGNNYITHNPMGIQTTCVDGAVINNIFSLLSVQSLAQLLMKALMVFASLYRQTYKDWRKDRWWAGLPLLRYKLAWMLCETMDFKVDLLAFHWHIFILQDWPRSEPVLRALSGLLMKKDWVWCS